MEHFSFLFTAFLILTFTRLNAAEPVDTSLDRQAITRTIKNYEEAWNRHDPAGLAENYTPDATWVNWFGSMYTGRADIESHYKTTHSTYFKDTHYYTRSIEDITFIKPDVAVVHVRTGLSDDSRYPGQVFEFRRMMVMTRTNGHWLIFAGQNAKLNDGVK